MLARSKLNSTESTIFKALIDNETSHEEFTTIIKEEGNYRKLKESTRIMKSQRSDTARNNLFEEGKIIGIDKSIKHNGIINNNLKSQV